MNTDDIPGLDEAETECRTQGGRSNEQPQIPQLAQM
jgi:hypothetical protein